MPVCSGASQANAWSPPGRLQLKKWGWPAIPFSVQRTPARAPVAAGDSPAHGSMHASHGQCHEGQSVKCWQRLIASVIQVAKT
mmetsp:Transcript_100249/g.313271  ORF Transcript_100249/g.313271 Transcript_100249/m.313271 type:complete len:83 (-) Transcript_100249:65-313(-)